MPRLKLIWASGGAYGGRPLGRWCQEHGNWQVEVVPKTKKKGFEVQPRRWIVERTFAWLNIHRRLSKDYERLVQTSETLILVATARLMLRRLVRLNS